MALIAYFALIIPLDFLVEEAPLALGLAVFAVLMVSPIIGAVAVLRLQGRAYKLGSAVVKPYVRALLVALVAALILGLENVFPFLNDNGVGVAVVSGAFLTLIVVPFVLPTLRFLMWLISPPNHG